MLIRKARTPTRYNLESLPAGGFGTDPVVGELIPDKKRSKEYKVTNRLQEGKRPLYAICFNLIDSRFHDVFASAGGNRGFMATYGVDCHNSYSHHMGGGERDDDLVSTYSMLTPTPFQDMASFKESVQRSYDDFVAGSNVHHQYMAFTNVNLKRFQEIDALRERRTSLPGMVVVYDGIEEVMIVKLKPSPLHSAVVARFHDILHEKFINLGVTKRIFSVGNGRFGDPNERCKEPDIGYKTDERNRDDFPNFVVEVGVAESLQMLQSDAIFWLTKSNERTRLVIIIHIDKVLRKILLQRWECVNVNDGRPRRANVRYPPRVIQSLELEEGKPYAGDAMEIPAATVMDTVPINLHVGEFVITGAELQELADDLWARC